MSKILEYVEERIGINLTFYFGVPIIISLFALVTFVVGWCIIHFLALVEDIFGDFTKTLAILWLIYTAVFLLVWWIIREGDPEND